MKKISYLPVLLALICCAVVFSCKKDDTYVPDTVTATVNGENLKYMPFFSDAQSLSATINNNSFQLGVIMHQDTDNRFIDIYIYNFSGTGQYYLTGQNGTAPWGTADYSTSYTNFEYDSKPGHPGLVNITRIDAKHKRVYGNFYYDAYDQYDSTKMAHITNGNFAVDYTQGE